MPRPFCPQREYHNGGRLITASDAPGDVHLRAARIPHTRGVIMSKSWRAAGVLLGVVFLAAGCEKSSTTPPGKPGDETYGKRLVGVWEGSEEGPKDGKPETVTVEFKADNTMKIAMG